MQKLKFPYKNDRNQRYSKQLFLEKWRELPIELRSVEPPFTLGTDREGLINLRKEYIQDADPTGYKTSIRLFGEFEYWEYLCGIRWFKEELKNWNRELDAKLQSEGLEKIRSLASGDDQKALVAAKYLANLEFKKGGIKRGRPSNEEVEGRLKQEAKERNAVDEDAERIKLVANRGQ